ncbi:jg25643 [Pararge aegeria aegeria]|uniref:Jg25643 protein n=1 Tax=Pararge aegeria aegeria TaxID=348720 RepID=A0A8S4QFJ7_9NEOP|nr:jg25643 [Pararge aegeria aegeria]
MTLLTSTLHNVEFQNCPESNKPDNLNASYHICQNAYTEIQSVTSYRRTWLTIAGGLFGFLVGFVLLLYIMHRHNVAQTKKTTKAINTAPPSVEDRNATAILLNNAA